MALHDQTLSQPQQIYLLPGASWPIPPNVYEVPTPIFVKTENADEKTPPKLAAIPHAMVLNKFQNNKQAEEAYGWGPQCLICTQSTQNLKEEDPKEAKNKEGRPSDKSFLSPKPTVVSIL